MQNNGSIQPSGGSRKYHDTVDFYLMTQKKEGWKTIPLVVLMRCLVHTIKNGSPSLICCRPAGLSGLNSS